MCEFKDFRRNIPCFEEYDENSFIGNVEGGFDGFGGIGVDPYSSANGNTTDGVCFSAVCRFDQGAAVEGAGVGFLKNSVLNILFQMKEMPSEN